MRAQASASKPHQNGAHKKERNKRMSELSPNKRRLLQYEKQKMARTKHARNHYDTPHSYAGEKASTQP